MWLAFALGSAFFAGMTAVLSKIGIKNIDSNLGTGIRTVVVLVSSFLFVIFTGEITEIFNISSRTFIFLVLSGVCTGLSWSFYNKSLKLGNVNHVVAVDKSSIVLTIILAFLILGEKLTYQKILAITIILIGTYLMITIQKVDKDQKIDNSWFFYALFSAVFASLTSILGKIGISNISSNLGTAIRTIFVLIMAWLIVFFQKKEINLKKIDKRTWIFLILSGISTGISWLCYYRALKLGEASIVVPIDKLSIVVSVIFSRILLKEYVTLKTFIGLSFIVLGTLLLL